MQSRPARTSATRSRFKFDGTGYYLKSTDEMYAIDSSDAWQEGCANTRLIAEMVDTTGMFEKRDLMPKFDIPEGYTEVSWFREETMRGMHRRFPDGIPDDRMKQVEYEMDTIISMGFPGYFLVVADFIMRAKKQGIAVGPGRGSTARLRRRRRPARHHRPRPDPARPDLRAGYLNPERISMPDVDIDFDERRRVEVIRYVTEKYGADKVARSAPTAPSRPRTRSRTPRACWATRTRWVTGSPRPCRRTSSARASRSPVSPTPAPPLLGGGRGPGNVRTNGMP
ncbi:Error-prone DNA polymerase [Streptomyces glaucescens]